MEVSLSAAGRNAATFAAVSAVESSSSSAAVRALVLVVTAAMVCGCTNRCNRSPEEELVAPAAGGTADEPPPQRLALPAGYGGAGRADGTVVDLGGQGTSAPRLTGTAHGPCPPDMVFVAGVFCIDRYEMSLVDVALGRPLSPHYPPSRDWTRTLFERFRASAPQSKRALGRRLSVPFPPDFQLEQEFVPRAVSQPDVLPAGYLNLPAAEQACREAGKRLCSRGEWVQACRGQEDRPFPYGHEYRSDVCNVHRRSHPARLLHGNSSEYHMDPRLGLTEDQEGPLLRRTGETAACVSRWGDDGIYDMVGNLDEWIDDPAGTFVGGFYSRATRDGCNSMIDVHAPAYFDYSLGARCCRDL